MAKQCEAITASSLHAARQQRCKLPAAGTVTHSGLTFDVCTRHLRDSKPTGYVPAKKWPKPDEVG
jgi:hypothetical protein